MAERLYSTAELSDLLDINRTSVNYLVRNDFFPDVQKVGGSYAVPVSNVLAYIDKKKAELQAEIDALIEAKLKIVDTL